MNANVHRQLNRRKRRIARRIENQPGVERSTPMMTASNIRYEIADRTRAIAPGGIGAIHLMARKVGLIHDIDEKLHLLKRHLPYHESDHVLNIAYNLLAGGSRIEHLEVRRNDEVYLDALGATRIPDPTTAGDFCRRFAEADVERLMDIFNEARLRVWKEQPADFFDEAFIDADGTLAPSGGCCKDGVDIAYDGTWGYHPLVVSLANTAEPLFLVNRTGNRPSHERADVYLDRAADLCRRAGFRKITFRGDSKFSQTTHLDRWDRAGVRFIFGIDAMPNLVALAEGLAGERILRVGATASLLDQDGPPAGPGASQGSGRLRAGVQDAEVARRGGGRVRVSPGGLQEVVPDDRAEEEAGGREGPVVAVRAGPVLLLHHQRSDDPGVGGGVPGQRPLRPGEPDRATQGRGEGAGDAGRGPGEQRGVHGDGEPGVEPEGVGGVAAAREGPVGGEVPVGEAVVVEGGVQHVLRGVDSGAVPGRADESSDRVSVAVVEPVAGRVPAVGGASARPAVVLRMECSEAGVRMLRSVMAPNRREAVC